MDSKFGKFMLKQKLGEGGMGEVWKATDTQLNREVAIKFLKGGDDDEIARFKREAETAGALNHANIAAVYEVGQLQGRHYIAMQFVEGQTLKAFAKVQRDHRLLVRLLREGCKAIAYAHARKTIHRDIKPDNFMVEPRGKSALHLYVMDFGLAKSTKGKIELTQTGAVMGTPAYMSPEQTRGERLDHRSDVWSLGATLYDILTDRKPFVGKTLYDTMRLVQEEDAKPPRQLNPKIDVDLELIVMKCLEKEKSRRYQAVANLAADLDRWLKGEPVHAHAPSMGYRIQKFVKRRTKMLAGSAVGLVIAFVAITALLWSNKKAADEFETSTLKSDADKIELAKKAEAEKKQREEADKKAADEKKRADETIKKKEAYDLTQRALIARGGGEYDVAIELFTKALALDRTAEYLGQLAYARWCKGDVNGAFKNVTESLAIKPTDIGLSTLGQIYFTRGEYQLALDACTRQVEFSPAAYVGYYNRAQSYCAIFNYVRQDLALIEKAIADLEMALKVERTFPNRPAVEALLQRLKTLYKK